MYYNFKTKFNFHTFFFYFFVCFLRSELLFLGWAWQACRGQVSVLPSEAAKACCLLLPPTWVSETCKVQRSRQGLGAMEQEQWNKSGWHQLGCLSQHGPPKRHPEPTWGLRLPGRGRQSGRQHPRVGGPQALGGTRLTVSRGLQDPSHSWPARQRAGQSLSPEGSVSYPRSGSLGPEGHRRHLLGEAGRLKPEAWGLGGLAESARGPHLPWGRHFPSSLDLQHGNQPVGPGDLRVASLEGRGGAGRTFPRGILGEMRGLNCLIYSNVSSYQVIFLFFVIFFEV